MIGDTPYDIEPARRAAFETAFNSSISAELARTTGSVGIEIRPVDRFQLEGHVVFEDAPSPEHIGSESDAA